MKGKLSVAFYGLIVGICLSNWLLVGVVKNNALALLMTLALLSLLLGEIGKTLTGKASGILIDSRNRISLSRLQMVGWTVVVLSGVTVAAAYNLSINAANPLNFTIPNELLIAMGIAGTSAVASPLVLATTRNPAPLAATTVADGQADPAAVAAAPTPAPATPAVATLHAKCSIDEAAWADLFKGEDAGTAGSVDISKVQQFFFTLLLLAVYALSMADAFTSGSRIGSLPALDQTFLYLLGISHATYLTYKAVPKPGAA